MQARADVERKLDAVDSRLRAAGEKEKDLDQRQAALIEKVRVLPGWAQQSAVYVFVGLGCCNLLLLMGCYWAAGWQCKDAVWGQRSSLSCGQAYSRSSAGKEH